jgi:hypothetical protein
MKLPTSTVTTLSLLALGIPLAALAADQLSSTDSRYKPPHREPRPLIDRVYDANKRFANINSVLGSNSPWVRATQCVAGPEFGAMGVHYVRPERIFEDSSVSPEEPEALIYEPLGGNRWQLVGVEFIVLKDLWEKQNPNAGVPTVEGHQMNLVGEPNRYGLPAFYELHVWAFEQNPVGSFSDWNTRVSCDKQPLVP